MIVSDVIGAATNLVSKQICQLWKGKQETVLFLKEYIVIILGLLDSDLFCVWYFLVQIKLTFW